MAAAVPDDGTTRYLCAAVYLDEDFADAAIREFLVEETRAVPPSPGLDAGAVLRDAVAARTARKIRDAVLLTLLLAFAIISLPLLMLWLFVAIGRAVLGGAHDRASAGKATFVAIAAVAILVLVLPQYGIRPLSLVGLDALTEGFTSTSLLLAALVGVLIFGVLAYWEQRVTELTRTRFRASFTPDATQARVGWERTLRTLGHDLWRRQLRRFDAAVADANQHGGADVVVYRTTMPFVGAGARYGGGAIPLPLVAEGSEVADADTAPAATTKPGSGTSPQPFSASELLDGVDEAVRAQAASPSLSPSGRLAGVSVHEQVFVSARRLLSRPDAPAVAGLLPRHGAPVPSIPRDRAHRLADLPDEVARQYPCYRVEAWERDLTVSTFVTASTDGKLLYLEWWHGVLPPIQERYRDIDHADTVGPWRRAFDAAVQLPASIPQRLSSLFSTIRPIRVVGDELDPDRYGAGASLREMAAEPVLPDFFQRSDTQRYVTLFEQAMVRGVRDFLGARGYSIATLREIAHNSITINGGNLAGANIGVGRTTQHNERASVRKGSTT